RAHLCEGPHGEVLLAALDPRPGRLRYSRPGCGIHGRHACVAPTSADVVAYLEYQRFAGQHPARCTRCACGGQWVLRKTYVSFTHRTRFAVIGGKSLVLSESARRIRPLLVQ